MGLFEITGGTGVYEGATGEGFGLIDLTFWFDKTDTGCSQIPALGQIAVLRGAPWLGDGARYGAGVVAPAPLKRPRL